MDIISAHRFIALRILVLDNNHISDLAGSLGPLPYLRVLRLNKNRITSFPGGGGGGSGGSGLPVPGSFASANHTVSTSNSSVSVSGSGYLARCFPQLEVLELGSNRITSLLSLHLQGLVNLRVLTLENNELTTITSGSVHSSSAAPGPGGLSGLRSLQQLVLAKNKIRKIEPGAFDDLVELRGLQLEENSLRSLNGFASSSSSASSVAAGGSAGGAGAGGGGGGGGVIVLPKLQSLFLAYNRVTELNEIGTCVCVCGCVCMCVVVQPCSLSPSPALPVRDCSLAHTFVVWCGCLIATNKQTKQTVDKQKQNTSFQVVVLHIWLN